MIKSGVKLIAVSTSIKAKSSGKIAEFNSEVIWKEKPVKTVDI
jgi:hypothetical protein